MIRVYNNKGQLVNTYVELEDGQTYHELTHECRSAGFTIESSEVYVGRLVPGGEDRTLLIPSEMSLVHKRRPSY